MKRFSKLVLRAALWGTGLEAPFALWAISGPHNNYVLSMIVMVAHTPAVGLLTILSRPFARKWNSVPVPVTILLVTQAILFSAMFLSIFWSRQKRKQKGELLAKI